MSNANILIKFYDFNMDDCKASVVIDDGFTISDFTVKPNNGVMQVYMPNSYKTIWPWTEISWPDIRAAILSEFNNMFQGFGQADVIFYDHELNGNCYADFEYKALDIHLKGCTVVIKDNRVYVYKPKALKYEWPFQTISWVAIREFIVREFRKNAKTKSKDNVTTVVTVHDITLDGSALFDVEIPSLNYEVRDGVIRYTDEKNIHVNLPSDYPVVVRLGITRKSAIKLIREEYLRQIEDLDVKHYKKQDSNHMENKKNKYGRVMNAERIPFAFRPNTKLRPIRKPLELKKAFIVKNLLNALIKNEIGTFEIETLSFIERFRYVTNTMIIDMFASGYISPGWRNITADKLAAIFKRLSEYNLVNISNFVCIDELNKDCITSKGNYQIYSLAEIGDTLLSELNRSHHYNPFDVYQNGDVVKSVLAANQWLIYWLSSYPDEINNNYDTAKVVRVLGVEKSAARIYAMVTCNNVFMVGEPVRRTYDFDAALNRAEIEEKLLRLINLMNFNGDLYTNSGYRPVEFKMNGKPTICYICEDEEHIKEVWEIIKPISVSHPGTTIWFTTDARLFNYSNEGNRFVEFSYDEEYKVIDLREYMGLGKERIYEIE